MDMKKDLSEEEKQTDQIDSIQKSDNFSTKEDNLQEI